MSCNQNDVHIDIKKLRRLQNLIYSMERENLKRKPAMSDGEMVEKIRKVIEEEVRKCF